MSNPKQRLTKFYDTMGAECKNYKVAYVGPPIVHFYIFLAKPTLMFILEKTLRTREKAKKGHGPSI